MHKKGPIELLLWLVVLIWAGNYTVGKFGMLDFPPLLFTALRFLIATPFLLALLRSQEGGLAFAASDMFQVFLVGLMGIALYQTVFITSVKLAAVTTTALGLGLSPIFTTLLGAILGQERFQLSSFLGCLVAFFGLTVVIYSSPVQTSVLDNIAGYGLALAAGFLWGLYPLLVNPLLKNHSALWVTSHSSLVGALILLAFSLPEMASFDWSRVSTLGWAALAYSALPVTVVALVAWYYCIEKIGASPVMLYMYPITPVAMVIAMFTIGEQVNLLQWVGAAITLLGVFIAKQLSTPQTTG